MSTIPPTGQVAAGDLKRGDRIVYANLVAEVVRVTGAAWFEDGDYVLNGVEVECRDVSGTAKLFLYRRRDHMFEVIR